MKKNWGSILFFVFLLIAPFVLSSINAIVDNNDLVEFAENTAEEESEEDLEDDNEYDFYQSYSASFLQQDTSFSLSKNKILLLFFADVNTPPPRF